VEEGIQSIPGDEKHNFKRKTEEVSLQSAV